MNIKFFKAKSLESKVKTRKLFWFIDAWDHNGCIPESMGHPVFFLLPFGPSSPSQSVLCSSAAFQNSNITQIWMGKTWPSIHEFGGFIRNFMTLSCRQIFLLLFGSKVHNSAYLLEDFNGFFLLYLISKGDEDSYCKSLIG